MTQHQSLGGIASIPSLTTQWAVHPRSQAERMLQGSSDAKMPDRIEMNLQKNCFSEIRTMLESPITKDFCRSLV